MRRVAVTGLGVISPSGNGPAELFNNLMAGRSAVRRISAAYAEKLSIGIAAEVQFKFSDYMSKKTTALDRTSQMALAAAAQAWTDSGITLDDSAKERAGVYIGTGMGGAQSLDEVTTQLYKENKSRVSPLSIVKIMSNAPAAHISIAYGLMGPCLTYTTACSSSSVAIGEAFRQIKYGLCDVAVSGGTESIVNYVSMKCWESLGVVALEDPADASASCKPFSKDRTGFVLGEGAAVIVLEDMERALKRGAKIYCELSGYGSTADAYHITGPTVNGQVRAMKLALDEAEMNADSIDYINAHGTATAANDVVETQAIKKVFGDIAYKLPVSSTKSMHGHLIGAAGAVEFVISVLAIGNKAVPPTTNLHIPDPECDLDYVPNAGRTHLNIKSAMSNSFAFGGTNAVLIVREI
ncbi:MAG TPA: beta-ketoacyl-[acyl-carrier-protein] synthase family protein [Dissulfurispiraceae bacterium]|nr:beta-ketoacyl-[acyl-carrier-protein] synthase family protein [Dissulfurispiraceae bacterium]